jgi:alpha/beta superfamily hydrolase
MNSGHGCGLDRLLLMLGTHVQEIYDQHNTSLSLIGWSLGGMYARELGALYPQLIRQVITLATPFGVSDFPMQQQSETPLVRSTSIYSQTDGIVNWESCVGQESIGHCNIEVEGVSHFGMVHHPEILKTVARLLKSPMNDE